MIASTLFTVRIYRKTVKFEERENSVAWSDHEPEKDSANKVVERAGSQDLLDDTLSLSLNIDEAEDPIMQVMLKSIQDPDLAPIYEGLPDLGSVMSKFSIFCYH